MVVPFESAVKGSLEGSRGDRVYVPATCRALDQADRFTPLSGTQLGWGMKVAQDTGSCLFGARFGFPPDYTLGEIDAELQRLQPILELMAAR